MGEASNAGTGKHAGVLWSAGTCHRFAQATCRRRRPARQRNPTHAPPLARATRAPIIPDTRGRWTATSRLGKAVTSHRTPKRAGEPSRARAAQASRDRSGSGFIPHFNLKTAVASAAPPVAVMEKHRADGWRAKGGGLEVLISRSGRGVDRPGASRDSKSAPKSAPNAPPQSTAPQCSSARSETGSRPSIAAAPVPPPRACWSGAA